jgi:biofilm PGA synthesis lipoprotein PgaB
MARQNPASLFLTLTLLAAGTALAAGPQSVQFVTIGYHDVQDNLARHYDPDQYASTTENLAGHFRWLAAEGYTVISIDDVLAARAGERRLPDRSVLLTFDDGFRSVYTHVYPLLKLFGYHAVVSPVTSWIETDGIVPYNREQLDASHFLTWAQLREMADSGLVEVASHSHDLHRGIVANPQGNELPAATSHAFHNERYESTPEYQARVRADLAASARAIEENIGTRPRAITWPYGAWNETGRRLAADLGMSISLTLDPMDPVDARGVIGREMSVANPGVERFADLFTGYRANPPVRAAQVDLDYVYDPDPDRQEANLSLLLDRVKAMGINTVFLQAFADPDGNGAAEAVYFPNRHLPMRADLFNRAAWQLRTRSNVSVYAWMPIMAFNTDSIPPDWQVLALPDGKPDPNAEPRLSIFVPAARQLIVEVYEDLARQAEFAGIHFHDDGRLNEFEDANPAAVRAYEQAIGRCVDAHALTGDALAGDWARFKSAALIRFTQELADRTADWHPELKTSRNLFATSLLLDGSETFLAQSFPQFLANYDYVTLMAMPRFEGYRNEKKFYRNLIDAVAAEPEGLANTTFQLQAMDWDRQRWLSGRSLQRTMKYLKSRGVVNLAYYPDDFIQGKPSLKHLRQGLSVREQIGAGDS